MTVVLPKDRRYLIGFRFPELIPFEMNTVDLSLVLVAFFRRAILEGKGITGGSQAALAANADIATSVDAFVTSTSRLEGFDSPRGRRAASRLVRGALTILVRENRSKELQIRGLSPFTLASIRPAFPAVSSGDTRRVDHFLCSVLLKRIDKRAEQAYDTKELHSYITREFGQGVCVQGHPSFDVRRMEGELPDLDILSELSLTLAEALHPISSRHDTGRYIAANPLAMFQARFGAHLRRYWSAFSDRSPMPLVIDQSIALIGFELTIMTIRLLHAVPTLIKDYEAATSTFDLSLESTCPQVYVDWVGDPRHLSWELARATARRDLGQLQPFAQAVLRLRYLNTQISSIKGEAEYRKIVAEALGSDQELDTSRYVVGLLTLANHSAISGELRVAARNDCKFILEENQISNSDSQDEDGPVTESEADRLYRDIAEAGGAPSDQVLALIHRASGAQTQKNIQGWLAGVGGIGTSHGLIHGGVNRNTWAYAPGNELLSVLVQLCAVDHDMKGGEPIPFGVAEFLEWLEDRFGVIVDRPPAGLGFDGPEHAAAARDNLQAMLRRLRLMGMFEDQTDDFTVQEITPPFATRV
ncbi:MAG: hypothetical protein QM692_05915 [Thermomicrobiales bacterium]